jgi:Zn-dependent protease
LIDWLLSDPTGFLLYSLYRVPALLLTLCCHEWAHAWVANRCGDPTARLMGRMTLDPRRHLDPLGTVLMVTMGFGWAKPVPINPRNFRHRIADDVKVSVAGVTVNLLLFLLLTSVAVALNGQLWKPEVILGIGKRRFLELNGLNLILVTQAGDFAAFLRHAWLAPVMAFITITAQMNLMIAIFNLLPIPPLDGYHVANDLLLRGRLHISPQVAQYGMIAILLLSFTTNILSDVLSFLASNIQGGVLSLFLMMTGG